MKSITLVLFSLCISFSAFAQKKPLDHSVYDSWQHVGEKLISNDGQWVVYTIDPQLGDNQLVIAKSDASWKKTLARGYAALITEDSRYVIFKIKALNKDIRDAKIKKKKPSEMPKDSLGILELGKDSIWKTPAVRSYKTPADAFGWVAYQLEKSNEPVAKPAVKNMGSRMADSLARVIDSLRNVVESLDKKKNKSRDEEDALDADGDDVSANGDSQASDLVLRSIESGAEIVFYNVLEYHFNKQGNKLLLEQARNPKDSASIRQVILYDLIEGRSVTLSRGGNDYTGFAMTEDGAQVAYLGEREAKPNDLQKFYKLWYYRDGTDSAVLLADRFTPGMKLGMTVSEFGAVSFSKSGQRIFFGSAPIPMPKDTTLVDFENPKLDIWHYKDDYLQTVQTFPARLKADLQANYLSVYDLPTRSIRQLGSREIPQVLQTKDGDGDTFVGVTDFGKRVESQWTGNTKKDIYAINVNNGEKTLVKENLSGFVYPAPGGRYICWYDRVTKDYFSWDGAVIRNISSGIKQSLFSEDWDLPEEPAPYGVAGWSENDDALFVYDKFDMWKIDPLRVQPPVNVTQQGRAAKTSWRYVRIDKEERSIKPGQVLHFRLFNTESKKSGYARMQGVGGSVTQMIPLQDLRFENLQKAKSATQYMATRESFVLPPDLFVCNGAENGAKTMLSAVNPQQANYNWGSAELFKWKAYNGKDATGVIFKPGDFDPKKKYPMICYFYEKLSDNINDYREPAPIRSAVNVPFFVSRGYLIFIPDIEYKTGHPGQSAYDYIVSGARAIVKKGWADSTKLALQGHSWGGYQAAILATMSPLFKAVWAGAPVANMTSAYGGIRWESGVSRQFQYEKSQSRIGGSLWDKDKLALYLENSPLFHLDKVTAPMVIMANDADGAVPWYQGIELFTGLRRLGRKVWMFNYNGQGHGLTQRQDMRDYQIRMQQFFDWILKGEKPVKWITDGVPATEKGKDWGLE